MKAEFSLQRKLAKPRACISLPPLYSHVTCFHLCSLSLLEGFKTVACYPVTAYNGLIASWRLIAPLRFYTFLAH